MGKRKKFAFEIFFVTFNFNCCDYTYISWYVRLNHVTLQNFISIIAVENPGHQSWPFSEGVSSLDASACMHHSFDTIKSLKIDILSSC